MGQTQNIFLLTAYAPLLYRWHIMHSHDAKEKWTAKGQGPFSWFKKDKRCSGWQQNCVIQMQNPSTFCVRICFIIFSNSVLYPLDWALNRLRFCNILLVTVLTWKSKLYFVLKYSIILISQKFTLFPWSLIKWNFCLFSTTIGMVWASHTCSDIHIACLTATLPILKK